MLHVDAIREKGAKVVFGVDATSLKKCKEVKEGREFDRVAFNFPHVGTYLASFLTKLSKPSGNFCTDSLTH